MKTHRPHAVTFDNGTHAGTVRYLGKRAAWPWYAEAVNGAQSWCATREDAADAVRLLQAQGVPTSA